MPRLLLAAVLVTVVVGCNEDAKSTAPAKPSPDASIFDKKEMPRENPKGGMPKGE